MTLAIVLSGGGARGDFEVGALELMYQRGYRPDILTGTSVGSINASKLAEGEGGPNQGLAGLRGLWHDLRWDSDMWEGAAWLRTIDPKLANAIVSQATPPMTGPTEFAAPPSAGWPGELAYGLSNAINGLSWLTTDGVALLKAAQAFMDARSVFTLAPIKRRIESGGLDESKVAAWARAGGRLRMATVGLESGLLRYVTETGLLVERDHKTTVQKVTQPTARAQAIAAQMMALQDEIAGAQDELRSAAPGEKARLVSLIRSKQAELVRLAAEMAVEQTKSTQVPLKVPVGVGALASSSIGVVFEPVTMGDECYVDGGHRDTLPLQAALDLGADRIFAVMASPPELRRVADMRRARVGDIAVRALLEVHLDEILQNELYPPTSWPGEYRLIAPTVELHGMLTIDPGLIRINMAYGYMRAADTLDGIDRHTTVGTNLDKLVEARYQQWELECRLFGRPIPGKPLEDSLAPQPQLEGEWRDAAARVEAATRSRQVAGRPMPARSALWGRTYERHPWRAETAAPVNLRSRLSGEAIALGVSNEGGANGRVMYALLSATGQWSGWKPVGLGYTTSSAVVDATLEGGGSHICWVGNDGWVYMQPLKIDGSLGTIWPVGNSNSALLQARPGSPVHGVSCKPGMLHVFYTNRAGRVIVARRDQVSGTWVEHGGLSGGMAAPSGHVTAVSRAQGTLDVFMVGTDGRVYTAHWQEGGAWTTWQPVLNIQGQPGQYVGAISRSNDLIDLFLVDTTGRTMTAAFNPANGWRGWWHIQGGVAAPGEAITAVSRRRDFLDIFVRGMNGKIFTAAWSPGAPSWGGWWNVADLQGQSSVGSVSRRDDQLDVVTVTAGNVPMVSSWPSPQGWTSAQPISEFWDLGE